MQESTLSNEPTAPNTGYARFLAACRLQHADATPIWFMRQAGRSSVGYKDLRQQYDVMTLIKTPELCTQMTLLPVQSFGVDGAVLYADIMLPLEGMGVELEIRNEGPVIHNPIRTLRDVEALRASDVEEAMPYVFEALRMVDHELADKQALIGFSGAPFTLACYLIEGKPSRDYAVAKTFMYSQPEAWDALMGKLTDVVTDYLLAQIRTGADVVQLFDSWVGTLGPSTYRRYVLPFMQRIFTVVRQTGTPSIHFGTGTASLLEVMVEAGSDVISVDWRVDLDSAWERIGYEHGIQGNLDPMVLLSSWSVVEEGMRDVLRRAGGRAGHIFNLGHGIPQTVDPALLKQLVDAVHAESRR
jgi:uroporphyrinogen decarboxylase